jgi:hypothetical protein
MKNPIDQPVEPVYGVSYDCAFFYNHRTSFLLYFATQRGVGGGAVRGWGFLFLQKEAHKGPSKAPSMSLSKCPSGVSGGLRGR